MTWRDKARPVIAEVIARVGTENMPRLRKALRNAFPWGPLECHPYKIWRDEIRNQLGLKRNQLGLKRKPVDPDQKALF